MNLFDVVEVRQEAVQQALAQALQNRHKPSMPMPSKRTSVMARSPDRERHDSGKTHKNAFFYVYFNLICLNKFKLLALSERLIAGYCYDY